MLDMFTRLLDYQTRAGGSKIVDALNRTVGIGDVINERCFSFLERYGPMKKYDSVVNRCI